MKRFGRFALSSAVLGIVSLFGFSAPSAGGDKVEICHFPPGDRAHFHTLLVGSGAVDAHVSNHADFVGACCARESICDDGNACTANFCHEDVCTSEPVDCDDGVACTDDSCNASTGCANVPNDAHCAAGQVCDSSVGCVKTCTVDIECDPDDDNPCTRGSCHKEPGHADGICLTAFSICPPPLVCNPEPVGNPCIP